MIGNNMDQYDEKHLEEIRQKYKGPRIETQESYWVVPGNRNPVASVRLLNFRDGLEWANSDEGKVCIDVAFLLRLIDDAHGLVSYQQPNHPISTV